MYAPQVSEPQMPIDLMDQGVYNSPEVPSMPPVPIVQEAPPSMPSIEQNIDRRPKPKVSFVFQVVFEFLMSIRRFSSKIISLISLEKYLYFHQCHLLLCLRRQHL